jgi:ketosteroid isomerase-like protein
MESENVAVVRRIFELFNRLDPDVKAAERSPEVEELLTLYDPEVEFVQPAIQPGAQTYRGREAFRGAWREWLDTWEEMRSTPTEVIERGDSVLAIAKTFFTGRDGVEIEMDIASIFTLVDGRVIRQRPYFDLNDARAVFAAEAKGR